MNTPLEYSKKKMGELVAGQIETIQEDLTRLAGVFAELVELPEPTLEDLDLARELETLHHCLVRIETRCASRQVSLEEEHYHQAVADEIAITVPPKTSCQWGAMRQNSKRAHQLANRLTQTLRLLRKQETELPGQAYSPDDVRRMNLSVVNSVNQLLAEWNHVQE